MRSLFLTRASAICSRRMTIAAAIPHPRNVYAAYRLMGALLRGRARGDRGVAATAKSLARWRRDVTQQPTRPPRLGSPCVAVTP
jgi:hypothetical protein